LPVGLPEEELEEDELLEDELLEMDDELLDDELLDEELLEDVELEEELELLDDELLPDDVPPPHAASINNAIPNGTSFLFIDFTKNCELFIIFPAVANLPPPTLEARWHQSYSPGVFVSLKGNKADLPMITPWPTRR
jgi:hypothetical protein